MYVLIFVLQELSGIPALGIVYRVEPVLPKTTFQGVSALKDIQEGVARSKLIQAGAQRCVCHWFNLVL